MRHITLTVYKGDSNNDRETHVCKESVGFCEDKLVSKPHIGEGGVTIHVRLKTEVVHELVKKKGAADKGLHTTRVRGKMRTEGRG